MTSTAHELTDMAWDCVYVDQTYFTHQAIVIDDVKRELLHAIKKHTFERTPMNPDMDIRDKMIVLFEELGEAAEHGDPELGKQLAERVGRLTRAMTYDEGTTQKLYEELIDLAAMAIGTAMGLVAAGRGVKVEAQRGIEP